MAPAVIVRDAQNRPVGGVTVQFVVTEGGGQVEGAAASTGADGIARATRWTLGPAGSQRLSATAGGLPPVVFRASLIPGTERIDIGVGPGSGTFTITEDGHPLKGFEMKVPAGAFDAVGSFAVRVAPDQTPPTLPAGFGLAGTIVEVGTGLARARRLLTLDVPVVRRPGRGVVIAFRDPVRGVLEVMPTVARTPNTVRVMTAHLRSDLLLAPGPAGTSSAARTAAEPFTLGQLVPIDFSLPMSPVPAVVNPDDARWPVLEAGTALAPNGHGPAIAALQTVAAAAGFKIGRAFLPLATPGFYPESGPMAIAALAKRDLEAAASEPTAELYGALGALGKPERDEIAAQHFGASLHLSGTPPVLAFRSRESTVAYANAIAAGGNSVDVLETTVTAPTRLTFTASSGWDGFGVRALLDEAPVAVDAVVPLPSFVLDLGTVTPHFGDLVTWSTLSGAARDASNGDLAGRAGLPTVIYGQEGALGEGISAFEPDLAVVRSRTATLRFDGGAGFGASGVMVHHPVSGAVVAQSPPGGSLKVSDLTGFSFRAGTREPYLIATVSSSSGRPRQASADRVTFHWAEFTVTPETVDLNAALDVDLRASVPDPPASYRLQWNWGDGNVESIASSVGAVHTYDAPGDYNVIVRLQETRPGGGPPNPTLAVDTVRVRSSPLPFWRITSISDPDELLDPEAVGNPFQDMIRRLLAVPQSALIAIEAEPGGRTVVRLRVLPSSTWGPGSCCPPPLAPFPGELRQSLGEQPTIVYPVGPFFAGYGTTEWAQSTTDLGAGTLTGQFVANGTQPRRIKNHGTQIAPTDFIRITATRSGLTMTGTIRVVAWFQDEETGEIDDDDPTTFDLPFTAVRLR